MCIYVNDAKNVGSCFQTFVIKLVSYQSRMRLTVCANVISLGYFIFKTYIFFSFLFGLSSKLYKNYIALLYSSTCHSVCNLFQVHPAMSNTPRQINGTLLLLLNLKMLRSRASKARKI